MLAYFRLFLKILWLILLCGFAASFVLSNDSRVTVRLFPLPFEADLPLYAFAAVLFLAGLFGGVILVSVSYAAAQFRLRRKCRASESRAVRLEQELQLREAAARARGIYVSGAAPSDVPAMIAPPR